MNYLSDNYLVIKKIGSGSFGEVYLAENKKYGGYVAAKVEDRTKTPRALREFKIYHFLRRSGFVSGIPKVYDFIQTPDFNIMFMQLLGPSLDDIFNKYNKKFSQNTVVKLAIQLITLMEKLHNLHFIHRDIKPNNFLIGRKNCVDKIYMMDFGLSKKYINKGKHIPFRDNKSLVGTARYASTNIHIGMEPSRRDDLESIGYMLIYFLKGSLPWQGLTRIQGKSHIRQIGEVKLCTGIEKLCEGVPECFKLYLAYCKRLSFTDTPNYKYLINLFTSSGIKPEFEWVKNPDHLISQNF